VVYSCTSGTDSPLSTLTVFLFIYVKEFTSIYIESSGREKEEKKIKEISMRQG
jgi:hypothetical protein